MKPNRIIFFFVITYIRDFSYKTLLTAGSYSDGRDKNGQDLSVRKL